jgi:chromosome segregation ATPase
MNDLQEEKKKIISEEQAKRAELIKKTEDYMKEYQQTFESVVPEKEALMRENMVMKQKIEAYVENTKAIKENVENQLKLKDQQNGVFEEEMRSQIRSKMEELSKQNEKAIQENQELKTKNTMYSKKFEELNNNIKQSNEVFTKMKEDIEKRNAKILLLDKDIAELKNKEKQTETSISELLHKV